MKDVGKGASAFLVDAACSEIVELGDHAEGCTVLRAEFSVL